MIKPATLWVALRTLRVAVFPPVLGPVMMTLRSSGFTQMLMGTGGRSWGDSSDSLSLPSTSESACSGMQSVVKPSLQDAALAYTRTSLKSFVNLRGQPAQAV